MVVYVNIQIKHGQFKISQLNKKDIDYQVTKG